LQQLYVAQETDQIARNLTAGEIAPGGITNAQLADDAVTASKIADLNVTTAKINDSAVTSAKIADGTIVNADVNASAAIAGTKVSPNFGSQNITTTGTATISGLTYPTSDGASDEVLKTNGSGTLSFGTILTVPAGAVFYLATSTAPTGYLKANGAAVSRTTYADLFAAVGTTYGSGDGSTTFNLPDLRGEFLRGWDDSRGVDSGRGFATFQADELKSHNHSISPSHVCGRAGGFSATAGSQQLSDAFLSIGYTGGTETRPRNIALLACIKY
jgi:phage-related tail fiber protein